MFGKKRKPNIKPVKMPEIGNVGITKLIARNEFHSTDRYIIPPGCEYYRRGEWATLSNGSEGWLLKGMYAIEDNAKAGA